MTTNFNTEKTNITKEDIVKMKELMDKMSIPGPYIVKTIDGFFKINSLPEDLIFEINNYCKLEFNEPVLIEQKRTCIPERYRSNLNSKRYRR